MSTPVLFIGKNCNNNCIMCSVMSGENEKNISYRDIEKRLEEIIKISKKIAITGGEATEHHNFLEILKRAKELGYKEIEISSNGVNLADEIFVKEIINLGVKKFSITLHGPRKLHNKITQKDSYDKAFQGIKNIIKHGFGKELTVDSVVMRSNANYLDDLWKNLLTIGVKKINPMFLLYEGRAKSNFEKETLSFLEIKKFFYNNQKIFEKFDMVLVTGLSRCILPVRLPISFFHIADYEKEKWDFHKRGGYFSKAKKKYICNDCPYFNQCTGFKKSILKVFGEEDIHEMIAWDNFIEESKKMIN